MAGPVSPRRRETRRYDYEPAGRVAARRGMSHSDVAALLGPDDRRSAYRRLARWRARGLTVWQADRVAVVLGCHPCEMWPSWWADCREDAPPEDLVRVAVSAARVWCDERQAEERERRQVWVEWVRAVDAAERWVDRRAARREVVTL